MASTEMKNDIDFLYALVVGVARKDKLAYPEKAKFRKWLQRSAAFKRAEKNEKFVLIRRRHPRGPWLVRNMIVLEVPDDFEPEGEGMTQAGAAAIPEPTPAVEDRGDAIDPKVKKHCTHCNKKKPLSEFYRNPETRDRKASWCKACTKEKALEAGHVWLAVDCAVDEPALLYQVRDGYLTVKEVDGPQRVRLKNPSGADTLELVNKIKESFLSASAN